MAEGTGLLNLHSGKLLSRVRIPPSPQGTMNFFVYVLLSLRHEETYVGQTDKLGERVLNHNFGRVKSTKAFRPWVLIHYEVYESRSEAMKREKWFKSPNGRKFIASLIFNWKDGGGLSDPAKRDRDLVPT